MTSTPAAAAAAKLTHETGGLYTVAPVSWPWQATSSPTWPSPSSGC